MQKKLEIKEKVEEPVTEMVEPETTAVTVYEDASHAVVAPNVIALPALGRIEGEISASDFDMPYLKIIQGVGEASLKYQEGSIVLNKAVLTKPPMPGEYSEPICLTVLKGKKIYREKVKWDGKNFGRMAETRAEAESWNSDYSEELRVLTLVRATTPEMKQRFDLEGPGGEVYTLAMGYFAGVSWGCGKTVIAATATTLSKGCYTWEWKFQIRKEIYGKGTCYVPKITLSTEHSPETIEWIKTIVM